MFKTSVMQLFRNSSNFARHIQTSKSILEKHKLGNTIKPQEINSSFRQPLSLKYYNQYLLKKSKTQAITSKKPGQIIELDCPCMCNRLRMDPLCLSK